MGNAERRNAGGTCACGTQPLGGGSVQQTLAIIRVIRVVGRVVVVAPCVLARLLHTAQAMDSAAAQSSCSVLELV